ncbi:MAG: hypothetical protein ACR2F6_07240 [Mycobacteriales bacterium]
MPRPTETLTGTHAPPSHSLPKGNFGAEILAARTVVGSSDLVLAYLATNCDTGISMTGGGTKANVFLQVTVVRRAGCEPTVRWPRTTTMPMTPPLGRRTLTDVTSGRRVPVMDSADLLRPTWLPAGFRSDGDGRTNPSGRHPDSYERGWAQTWSAPGAKADPRISCVQSGRPGLLVLQGSRMGEGDAEAVAASVRIGSAAGSVWKDHYGRYRVRWHPADAPAGWYVYLMSTSSCVQPRSPGLPLSALLRIARGMR